MQDRPSAVECWWCFSPTPSAHGGFVHPAARVVSVCVYICMQKDYVHTVSYVYKISKYIYISEKLEMAVD